MNKISYDFTCAVPSQKGFGAKHEHWWILLGTFLGLIVEICVRLGCGEPLIAILDIFTIILDVCD